MKISKEQKRLDAVKTVFPLFIAIECDCCHDEFVREEMFKVNRWKVNKNVATWFYCKNCCKTREDVVNQIDSDRTPFGIAFVDRF